MVMYIRKHISIYLPLKIYGFALKRVYYFEQWRRRRHWTEQTGLGILIGDLVLNSLQNKDYVCHAECCSVLNVIKGEEKNNLMQNMHGE